MTGAHVCHLTSALTMWPQIHVFLGVGSTSQAELAPPELSAVAPVHGEVINAACGA